jgi:hypothetical protein
VSDKRTIGAASILVALGPIVFMAIFGSWSAAGLPQSDASDPAIAIPFLRANGVLVLAPTVNSIVMHLAAIVLALGLYGVLRERAPLLAATGALLGLVWGVLDIAQSLVMYNAVLGRPSADPATIDVITKGLQNAAHLGGGLWTLTIVATSAAVFGRAHRVLGALTGVVFALHPLIVPVQPSWFYLEFILLPLWFAWTGIAILRSAGSARAVRAAPAYS